MGTRVNHVPCTHPVASRQRYKVLRNDRASEQVLDILFQRIMSDTGAQGRPK
eukprot:GDKH01004324.1.p5 GENE.GDKH01004324.1~~GDKH01004324.1.p5  ORF type:complete len:52 (-),score=6.27 GDKH01004324.1:287-442(-)